MSVQRGAEHRVSDGPEFSQLGLVIKSRLGSDIRRIPVLNDDLTYDELMLMMQRVYRGKLTGSDEITIKYADEDGDLISVVDSSDLSFAIQNCRGVLQLTLFVNGEPRLRHESSEVRQLRSELLVMRDKVEQLINRLELSSFTATTSETVATDNGAVPSDGVTVADGGKAASSLVHTTQPLSPMSGREFDPLSANQKPGTYEEVAQQKVLSSFGVAATAAAAVDGGASVRSGTPDSVSSAGSARQQPQPQYQYAGQPGYQHSHAVPGYMAGQPPYQPDMSQPPPQPGGFVGGQDAAHTGYSQVHARQQDPQLYARQQVAHHQQPPQPQYVHQGAAPASGGIPAVNPYARGSAYSAHYPRPHGQFPPTQ